MLAGGLVGGGQIDSACEETGRHWVSGTDREHASRETACEMAAAAMVRDSGVERSRRGSNRASRPTGLLLAIVEQILHTRGAAARTNVVMAVVIHRAAIQTHIA